MAGVAPAARGYMTHGATSLRALAAFLVVVAVTTGTSAYLQVLDEMNGSDPPRHLTATQANTWLEPPPVEPYVPRPLPGLQNISFVKGFVLPPPITDPVPIVHIVGPDLNSTHGREMLERYNLHWADGSTEIESGPDWYRLRNDTRFTVVGTRTGYIHYDEDKPEGSYGALVTDIETNASLLNRTEGRQVAISWLKEHNLYNSSWELDYNYTLTSSGSIADPGKRYHHYFYRFRPVIDDRMVYGRQRPSISVKVTPFGQVIDVDADTARLVVGPETNPNTYPDPVDMLVHLDENLGSYTCPMCVQNATIISVEPAYGVGHRLWRDDDESTAWPCWYVTFTVNDEEYEREHCL